MKLTKQKLKGMIMEELTTLKQESLNPEWDKAGNIKSALVLLADKLEMSEDTVLVRAIVEDLRLAVVAMEERLNKKFGGPESAYGELNKALRAIENAYKNEATRDKTQQAVDDLYRRFGRHEPAPEELMP